VRLAETEGHVRAFTRHGALLAPLLESLAASPQASPYARELAAACRAVTVGTPPAGAPAPKGSAGQAPTLSARELEVLHLLATDLDGPEIAGRLYVSLNTLRTHTKSIYTKLDVNSRRAAVRRGRELGLLGGH
jgi:LuxR family maltose regulon positive regulatory protein